MKQRWMKLGQLADRSGQLIRRATLPTPQDLGSGRIRLFYGALDEGMVSRIESVEIDLALPTVTLSAAIRVLDIGEPGSFDDNGVVPFTVLTMGPETFLLYGGFQKQTKIPYTILSGLAVSRDRGIAFERRSTTAVLERSAAEPHIRTAPCVLVTDNGPRLWYIAGTGWLRRDDRVLPTYDLRTMSSADIEEWPDAGEICLTPTGDEIGFGRPHVVYGGTGYRMWYSIRRVTGYRLGYAESADGRHWRRLDERLDMGQAIEGFDDEMMCYSALVPYDGRLVMFYNGNGYGRTGIGVAVLQVQE